MWNNDEWAKAHISKRHPGVTTEDAWEIVFLLKSFPLVSPDQYRFPPFRRYWTIGRTTKGKELLVVWEQWRGTKNLITAYPPNEEQVRAYDAKTKKAKR